jgi:hypothetical protein
MCQPGAEDVLWRNFRRRSKECTCSESHTTVTRRRTFGRGVCGAGFQYIPVSERRPLSVPWSLVVRRAPCAALIQRDVGCFRQTIHAATGIRSRTPRRSSAPRELISTFRHSPRVRVHRVRRALLDHEHRVAGSLMISLISCAALASVLNLHIPSTELDYASRQDLKFRNADSLERESSSLDAVVIACERPLE